MLAVKAPSRKPPVPYPPLVFDSALWEKDVLLLKDGETEANLYESYVNEARKAGIVDELEDDIYAENQQTPTTVSSLSVQSPLQSPRQSFVSLRSSVSTAITDPSRCSKDMHGDGSLLSVPISNPRLSGPPPSYRSYNSYDSVMDSFRPRLKPRSSSTASSFSLSLSSILKRPKSPHKKRGSRSFFHRKESNTCYSRSCHGYETSTLAHSLMPVQDLKCGHSLSAPAIRLHVNEASEQIPRIPPSCCGIPIPASVLSGVIGADELEDLMSNLVMSYDVEPKSSTTEIDISAPPTERTSRKDLLLDVKLTQSPLLSPHRFDIQPGSQSSTYLPPQSSVLSQSPRPASLNEIASKAEEIRQVDQAMKDARFTQMRCEQKEEQDRTRTFEFRQRRLLEQHYHRLQMEYWETHTKERKDLEAKHQSAIETLEEMQMDREIELEKQHEEETKNVATALKYMEAYCGVNPDVEILSTPGSGTKRTVTDEDRVKLQHQYAIQDNLPAKHEAAITVLRARQERTLKARMKKQDEELVQLDMEFETQLSTLSVAEKQEKGILEQLGVSRRKRLDRRWQIRFAIWKKESGDGQGENWAPRIPALAWPDALTSAQELNGTAGEAMDFLVEKVGVLV